MPNGEMVPIGDADRHLAEIKKHWKDNDDIYEMLCSFFKNCLKKGYDAAAYAYGEKILLYASTQDKKAYWILQMGALKEKDGKYKEAIKTYLLAFALTPAQNDIWYFLNNNLGYCLNYVGRYGEAERHCHDAIEIEPRRHNAFKNLGVSLKGQGKYSEAAKALIEAIQLAPRDQRALKLLEELIESHKNELDEINDLLVTLNACRELVKHVNQENRKEMMQ
jgi:tetratricopeptide (TPR) repeat protein